MEPLDNATQARQYIMRMLPSVEHIQRTYASGKTSLFYCHQDGLRFILPVTFDLGDYFKYEPMQRLIDDVSAQIKAAVVVIQPMTMQGRKVRLIPSRKQEYLALYDAPPYKHLHMAQYPATYLIFPNNDTEWYCVKEGSEVSEICLWGLFDTINALTEFLEVIE